MGKGDSLPFSEGSIHVLGGGGGGVEMRRSASVKKRRCQPWRGENINGGFSFREVGSSSNGGSFSTERDIPYLPEYNISTDDRGGG